MQLKEKSNYYEVAAGELRGRGRMEVIITIAEYKNQLKALGYSEATIHAYGFGLDLFRRYLEGRDIADIKQVSHKVILDYQEKIMAEDIAVNSKALKIRPVKRLFEYLTESHKLLINPTEGIVETTKINRNIGTVLTVDEVQKLFSQPNLSLRPHIRNRAVMEVLYSTGIRIDELLNLEVYHADFNDHVLYVRKGKGKKERAVPMGKSAAKYLKEYLENIRPRWARKNPKERKMFLNHYGLALTRGTVQGFLRKYRIEAGIKKPVSPHTLRRSCATHLLSQGADIRYVQKLLGHKNLKTTQVYTKIMPVDIKATHNKTHPQL